MTGGTTVWDLLSQATRELLEPFSRQDVIRWFAEHHPDVPGNTASTMLNHSTAESPAASKGSTFAGRTPLVSRVGRGLYTQFRALLTHPWVISGRGGWGGGRRG